MRQLSGRLVAYIFERVLLCLRQLADLLFQRHGCEQRLDFGVIRRKSFLADDSSIATATDFIIQVS